MDQPPLTTEKPDMADRTTLEALEQYAAQLSLAARRSNEASDLQHAFVHGDDETDVLTESGPLPTLAKMAKGWGQLAEKAIGGLGVVNPTGDYEVGKAYKARDLFLSGGVVYVVAHDYTSVSLDQDMADGHVGVFQGLTREDLSDTALSLSRGAGIVYRASRQLFSFDELLAVSGRYDGDVVYLVSYWKDYPVRESGGNFIWRKGSAITDYGTIAAPEGANGYWEREFKCASPEYFGAVGQPLALNVFFGTLKEARVRYPHAYELTDLIDWAATREVFYLARTPAWIIGCHLKTYYLNRKIPIRDRELSGACKGFIGAGPWRSTFVFQNAGNVTDVFPSTMPTGTPTSEMESLYTRDEEASVQFGFVSSNFNENSETGGWSDVVMENIAIQGPAHGVCILLANGGRVRTRWCQFNGNPRVAFVSCNNIAMSWNENMFSGAAGTLARIGLLNLSNSYREITHSARGITGGGEATSMMLLLLPKTHLGVIPGSRTSWTTVRALSRIGSHGVTLTLEGRTTSYAVI
ncbi:hypothetical protein [Halotalea alkalilenta]|uniref:Uncharacterized protein n=1 Tax=Halotalea alkalilenta TaxID=376489 RepID=A0A172YFW2_9GAMM|nr:hypothetical protein [Halotalea alkalilenta]ANF58160.1 hypothetical protein A5892_12360 [Halotalea alkalilenta]